MGAHNVCFGAKIRKIGIHRHTPVLLCKGGICGVFLYGHVFLNYGKLKMVVRFLIANLF